MRRSTNTTNREARIVLRDDAQNCWLHFTALHEVVSVFRSDEVCAAIQHVTAAVEHDGLHAAGFIAYEAASAFDPSLPAKDDPAFPLLWFGLFEPPRVTSAPPPADGIDLPAAWRSSITREEHYRCVQTIRARISAGDVYQANFTYRLRAATTAAPWDLFVHLLGEQAPPYAAFIDTGAWAVCSVSPELFLRLDGEQIESRPMKGTAHRGLWCEDDAAKAAALSASAKERAENVMIADMMRNDLGRVAVCGSVEVPSLFDVERYPAVWQMTSTVRARTTAPLEQILAATFPPASCTGAPKRRAMEIIAELETEPRRIYTGAIGFIAPGRRAQFSVAIRTLLIEKATGQAEYGVGGGIVWDSEPNQEWDECAAKARTLSPRRRDFDLLETLRWTPDESYALLEHHLARLARSAQYFRFDVDLAHVREQLARLAASLPAAPHRVRLEISHGGALHCQTALLDPDALRFRDIRLAENAIDANDVFLYHKTSRRRVYEQALQSRPGSEDVLLYNAAGEITESTIANIAVEIDGVLCTPPLRCGLLPGTYRAWMLEQRRLQERTVCIEEALRSPCVYLMNAVRGMQQVRILTGNDSSSGLRNGQALSSANAF